MIGNGSKANQRKVGAERRGGEAWEPVGAGSEVPLFPELAGGRGPALASKATNPRRPLGAEEGPGGPGGEGKGWEDPSGIHPKLGREVYRGELQRALAERIAGRPVAVMGSSLVDLETGEILDCGAGEDRALYFAAAHAIAAENRWRWVGFRRGSDVRGEAEGVALGGSAWAVSDRADPSYQARLKTRARKQIGTAMDRGWARLRVGRLLTRRWRERFVTLTGPSRDWTSRLEEWETHNKAFERLRETGWFRERVWGGVKNLEDPGAERPHVHSHHIWISHYVPQVALAWAWTGAFLAQLRSEAGRGDGQAEAFADPRQDWMERGWTLEKVQGIEDAMAEAKRRMKRARTKEARRYWEDTAGSWGVLLDQIRRACFVVDVRLVSGKTSASTIERQEALQEVAKYVTKTTDLLERPQADLLGLLLPARAPRVFDTFGGCRNVKKDETDPLKVVSEALRAAGQGAGIRAGASLDTAAIISGSACAETGAENDGEAAGALQVEVRPPPKRPRGPTWRQLMTQLSLSDWIRVMRVKAESGAMWAMKRLKDQGILAWTVEEALELGACPMPF